MTPQHNFRTEPLLENEQPLEASPYFDAALRHLEGNDQFHLLWMLRQNPAVLLDYLRMRANTAMAAQHELRKSDPDQPLYPLRQAVTELVILPDGPEEPVILTKPREVEELQRRQTKWEAWLYGGNVKATYPTPPHRLTAPAKPASPSPASA